MFARPMMRIFGHEFEYGWPILVIGTIGQLVNCGVGSVGYLLLMSGNEKRLVKVQSVMAAVMVVLCAVLVPLWGLVGAAFAAAATNVGTNLWNLLEVRKTLGFSPYNRGYLRLLPATGASVAGTLIVRRYAGFFRHDWLAVGVAFGLAYSIFGGMILLVGLDSDDRLIAAAMWSRVRGVFAGAGVSA